MSSLARVAVAMLLLGGWAMTVRAEDEGSRGAGVETTGDGNPRQGGSAIGKGGKHKPPPPPPPGGSIPTYAGDIKALLDSRCVSCHGRRSPGGGLRFDTYGTAASNASSGLAAVVAGRMPKGGALTATEAKLLQDWVAGGRPK